MPSKSETASFITMPLLFIVFASSNTDLNRLSSFLIRKPASSLIYAASETHCDIKVLIIATSSTMW